MNRHWLPGLALVLVALSAGQVLAQSAPTTAKPAVGSQAARREAAHNYFTDVVLLDQDGKERRLYSDLMQDRTVIISVYFTSCQAACPALNKQVAKIQDALGERLGRDVYILSISVDPETDTPPRIKEYAASYVKNPGWVFLTGTKANVDLALKRLGQYVDNPDDHMNLLLIGNEKTGLWKKAFGFAGIEELMPIVESVVGDAG